MSQSDFIHTDFIEKYNLCASSIHFQAVAMAGYGMEKTVINSSRIQTMFLNGQMQRSVRIQILHKHDLAFLKVTM